MFKPMDVRFWKYVDKGLPAEECWPWKGATDQHGYGRIQRGGKDGGLVKAHRAAYEILVGPIPEGLVICHRCDNPNCVNPAHLFAGTMQDNTQDMVRKGRAARMVGEASPVLKVPDETVLQIRERYAAGEDAGMLAAEFDVGKRYVFALVTGRRRPEAPGPLTWRKGPYKGRTAA